MLADDTLKASLAEAIKEDKVLEWVAAQGVEATEEELLAYMKAVVAESGELTDEQLDEVAGGSYIDSFGSVCYKVISIGLMGDGCWE